MTRLELGVPCETGDYTDCCFGIHHATAVGSLFRPDDPLLEQILFGATGIDSQPDAAILWLSDMPNAPPSWASARSHEG